MVTSANAIDEETLKALYEYNMNRGEEPVPVTRKRKNLDNADTEGNQKAEPVPPWGGKELWSMLQPLYLISFLCPLRYDDALRIQWH